MLVIGMATLFAGYTVAGYGWVLLKGWDIPFRQWVSPLHPYTWPGGGGDPPPIGADRLFPSSTPGAGGSASGAAGARGTTLTPGEAAAKKRQQAGTGVAGRLGP